ncbi:hypothetical protein [Mycolicibacterium peregrinum]|uniref:hypothetical protein n=1 Tax=Mycolicibacterium peregrinum TaxID=43304 RepID=UPI003AAE5343
MRGKAIRVGTGALTLLALSGCGGGIDIADPLASTTTPTGPVTTLPMTTPQRERPSEFAVPAYGVEPTTTRVLSPGEVTCPPPPGPTVTAGSQAPGSPTLTVAVPEGFTEVTPHAAAVRLTGLAGMTAEITLTPTTRTARADFEQYADDRVAKHSISSVSVLPGDLCGYSGQKLTGILAEQPGKGIEYADRIVHVWTNQGAFLAVVRLEAPSETPGFDDASSAMLADFGITMPG